MESLLFDLEQSDGRQKDTSNSSKSKVSGVPLPARLRPDSFDEYIGQKHLLSEGKLLKRAIDSDAFSSIVLFGPPGVGKTSLAELIAKVTDAEFIRLSGVTLKVSDLRKVIAEAVFRRDMKGRRTIVFVDEIHRFNRAQQDSLLPDIENGNIRFIGATTQNPYFHIISPLLSRSLVFRLEPLAKDEIKQLLSKAVKDKKGYGNLSIDITDEALEFWAEICDGDGRRALNALEIAVLTADRKDDKITISLAQAEASIQQKSLNYGEDEHYDTISAFIKSMRGSDPDAALYWMAKMLNAGEDIMFIARRIIIFASEDVGNADPNALQVAVSAMKAVEMIGMPEARIILAQAVTYCATAPKSNASYLGINQAVKDVENNRVQTVQSRQGIDVSPREIQIYNNLIKSGIQKGQSIHHVIAAHKDIFQKCEKSIYNYFNKSYFSLPRGDMPKMCMRKPRKHEKITHKIDKLCRQNRTLDDYKKFKIENPNITEVQMDSVIGVIGGKVLLTLQLESGLMLAQIRDTNNSQSVIDYFDILEEKFGTDNFKKIFPVILTDNGSEFSNPTAIETSILSKQQRTRVFYCDPYSSWQKAKVENNHTNLRRILAKGISFDSLNQNDINLVLSHLNSYMRKSYDDIPAITRFNNIFGKNILELLDINLIDPDDVILEPMLLGGKI